MRLAWVTYESRIPYLTASNCNRVACAAQALHLLQLHPTAAERETRKRAASDALALYRSVADGLVLTDVVSANAVIEGGLGAIEGERRRRVVGAVREVRKRVACAERGVQRRHEVSVRYGFVALALPTHAACVTLADRRPFLDNVAVGLIDYTRVSCEAPAPRVSPSGV